MMEDLLPHAVQILDFSHVKPYLWEAGKLIYGEGSAFLAPWVKEQETLRIDPTQGAFTPVHGEPTVR